MDGFIIGLTTLKFEFVFHPVEDFPDVSGESKDVTEGDDRGEFAVAAVAMQQFLSDRESEVVVSSDWVRLRSFACVLCPHEVSAGCFRVIIAHTCETHDGCGDAYVVVDTLNCHPVDLVASIAKERHDAIVDDRYFVTLGVQCAVRLCKLAGDIQVCFAGECVLVGVVHP